MIGKGEKAEEECGLVIRGVSEGVWILRDHVAGDIRDTTRKYTTTSLQVEHVSNWEG